MAGKSRALLADLGGATKKDILELAESHRVRYLRLMFTDILGINKNVEIPASQFSKALDGDIMFDGSSIEGFVRIEESDMLLAPDLSTFKIFPGGTPESRVARLICDITTPDGAPFDGDPRGALKRQVARAASHGFTMNAGMEAEFFMFKLGPDGAPTTATQSPWLVRQGTRVQTRRPEVRATIGSGSRSGRSIKCNCPTTSPAATGAPSGTKFS